MLKIPNSVKIYDFWEAWDTPKRKNFSKKILQELFFHKMTQPEEVKLKTYKI